MQLMSLHQFVSDLFPRAGYLGQSISLIRRDRDMGCLGGRASDLCIGLSLVPVPPHSDHE